jgi:TRAP-type C4-dicarboxylate transport system permease small subunit
MEQNKKAREPFEAYICVVLFALIVIVLTTEVIARYLFSSSFRWSEELSRFLFIWLIFIGASYAALKKSHIYIETFFTLLPKKVKPYAQLIGNVIWLVFSIFACYLGIDQTLAMYNTAQLSPGLQIPMYFVYVSIPLGYLLMTFRVFQLIVLEIKDLRNKPLEEEGNN